MRDALVEVTYRAAWQMVRWMPEKPADMVFRQLADRAWKNDGRGVQQLRLNLRRVVGEGLSDAELETLVRDAMRSYLRYWKEAFRLPTYSAEDVVRRFEIHGFDAGPGSASREGRGAIIALPHSGNWDLAGAWVSTQGLQLSTVAERLKPEGVFQSFLEYRRKLGMNIIPLTGAGRPLQEELTECVHNGDVVALVADRDMSRGGVNVDFFGHRAVFPAGPATMAVRTGAPLYAAHIYAEKDRYVCHVSEEISTAGEENEREGVEKATQQVADFFQAGIARHPADWHMLQRFWPDLRVTTEPTNGKSIEEKS